MKKIAGAAALLFVVAAAAVVFLGRDGEYAVPYMFRDPRSAGGRGPVRVTLEGAVVRDATDREAPLEVWASRPEFAVHVEGASPDHPVLVRNALPLDAYEPTVPGVRPLKGSLLALQLPGTYFFRPKPLEQYAFLVMGDPRNHLGRFATALQAGRSALFALCLGDLVSDGDPLEYAAVAVAAARSPVPIYFTVGNHDLDKGGRRFYRTLFGEESYSFRVGADLFAVLDTGADHPYLGDRRLEWLMSALDVPGTRHRLAFFHTPPLDPRPGGSHHLHYPPLRRGLQRVLREAGVSDAFAAHIHDYAEGEVEGVRYVITGGLRAGEQARYAPHVLRVEVAPDEVRWNRLAVEPTTPGKTRRLSRWTEDPT